MSLAVRSADTERLNLDRGRRKLEGKVALITGGAKGMGGTISELFAHEGAILALAARTVDDLDAEVARIREGKPDLEAMTIEADVTSEASTAAMASDVLERYGRIDILVNTAGVIGPIETPAHLVSEAEWDHVHDVNAKGTFLSCKAVLPHMIERRQGKIVNIAGTSGLRGYKNRVSYSASKWAVRGITRTIALEVGVHNINCNCVAPGPIFGDRMDKIIRSKAETRGETYEQVFDEYLSQQAIKRFTSPVDIAYACLYLVSEESRQVTGQCITVDGGWDV
jgi:NAD(P)-dependent dehydrogenase (short-subunit alcohol dehydrogenase family)